MKERHYQLTSCTEMLNGYYQLQRFLFLKAIIRMFLFLFILMILCINSRIKAIRRNIKNQSSTKNQMQCNEQLTRSLIIVKYV